MKKLLHLGLTSLFIVCLASCSKSDLGTNKKDAITNNTGSDLSNNNQNGNGSNSQAVSHIHPFINQPEELELGNQKISVIRGTGTEDVIFYVVLDPGYAPDLFAENKLSLVNMNTDAYFMDCTLLSSELASEHGIKVPKELSEKTFMFAKLNLASLAQYSGVPISLHSEIYLNNQGGASTGSKLLYAFQYEYQPDHL